MSTNVDVSGGGTRGRPIHFPPRQQPLNETPDETEPSYSYEEQSFLAYDREEDAVDEFHRQFAASSGAGGRHNNNNNNNNNNNQHNHNNQQLRIHHQHLQKYLT